MSQSPHHHHRHHHGNAKVGRIIVAVGCLILLADALYTCKVTVELGDKMTSMTNVSAFVVLIWVYTGAGAMCMRKMWGRFLVLTILYIETLSTFVQGIVAVNDTEGQWALIAKTLFMNSAIYLVVSLVFTHSRHIKRITSRTWE